MRMPEAGTGLMTNTALAPSPTGNPTGEPHATGSRDIVRRAGVAAVTVDRTATERAQWREEHLAIPGTGHIHFAALPSEDDLADQLARRVAGDPLDARLHVSRINHHVLHDDRDRAYGAVVDVFLAFGREAYGLRSRLFNGVRRLIGSDRARMLEGFLDTGLRPDNSVSWCPGSMLSSGATGVTDIVRRSEPVVGR